MPIDSYRDLRIKIFADGADVGSIRDLAQKDYIRGFTTNPTLMRAAGVVDYVGFGREIVALIPDRPISIEVLSDDLPEMRRQALKISSWGQNVYVKIPVTDTQGVSLCPLVRELSLLGVRINVTAILALGQVEEACRALQGGAPSIVSVFAGRVADSGRDPVTHMREALRICRSFDRSIELLWASPRELLNIVQADEAGVDIITVLPDILRKLPLIGKGLEEFSLETVRMFVRDGILAGYVL